MALGISDHTPIEHKPGECPSEETGSSCMFCDGGLFGCSVCGGLEGGMPTYCPGVPMSYDRAQEVYRGEIDFRLNVGWIMAPSKYSPAHYLRNVSNHCQCFVCPDCPHPDVFYCNACEPANA